MTDHRKLLAATFARLGAVEFARLRRYRGKFLCGVPQAITYFRYDGKT